MSTKKKTAAKAAPASADKAAVKTADAKKTTTTHTAGAKGVDAKKTPTVEKTLAKKAAAAKRTAKPVAATAVPAKSPAPRKAPAPKATVPATPKDPARDELRFTIESAFERRGSLTMDEIDGSTRPAVEQVVDGLETGTYRVAEPDGRGGWSVNEWLKKAVLLYFRTQEMELVEADPAPFWDKIPARFEGYDEAAFRKLGVRVVPGAIARRGAHIGKDVVLMPSFVNIGAHIGEGTMVDTWATVGSCAQVGKHCHISGGAGIGGVLEPLQATPTIIEDHCFIGARSEVVEGVIVGHHSVIGMGVFLGQSTRIYDRAAKTVSYGVVPPGSVVVAGSLPAADGSHALYCAVIVKQVDAKTRSKTSVNELLRGHAQ